MGIIKDIIDDYENLIKTRITIPIDNGDIIKFTFQPQSLPHLLGLQYLVDNPVLFEYSQNRLSATELYNGMRKGQINCDEFEKSKYYKERYHNRIKYFSSATILNIIRSRQIVKFNPEKIKNFETKLENLDYMFWQRAKDENDNYGYFGIGFMATGNMTDSNYPNTFFFRADNEYIRDQHKVIPTSFMMRDKHNKTTFEIYWNQIRESMMKNPHYRYLIKECADSDFKTFQTSEDEETLKHYRLLRADELNKAYLPYMDKEFRWTNDEKMYILSSLDETRRAMYPYEIKMLLNSYRQRSIV
ncbi:MAG: PBECR4 domain-containing protein [Dysgonamonadaceae bacterium]|nr:PBECR4 domain-containing protein [Dysgonamonadaceae bacterium]